MEECRWKKNRKLSRKESNEKERRENILGGRTNITDTF
jgi:hypothetical protein